VIQSQPSQRTLPYSAVLSSLCSLRKLRYRAGNFRGLRGRINCFNLGGLTLLLCTNLPQLHVHSLLELSQGGRSPIVLPSGETRAFLEDGDEVVFRGACRRRGAASIGLGEARGRVVG